MCGGGDIAAGFALVAKPLIDSGVKVAILGSTSKHRGNDRHALLRSIDDFEHIGRISPHIGLVTGDTVVSQSAIRRSSNTDSPFQHPEA